MQASNWPTPNASTGGTHTGLTEETALKEVERGNQIGLGAAVVLQNWHNKEVANWPTPNTMDELPPRSEEGTKKLFEGARKGRKAPSNLREFVHEENWPTPTTQETPHEEMELTETGRRKTKDGKDSHSLNLQDVSANWPTVTANSATYSNGERGPNLIEEAKKWPTPRSQESFQGEEAMKAYVDAGYQQPKTRGGQTRQGTFDTTLSTAAAANWPNLIEEAKKWPTPNASEHKYRMQGNTQQSNGLTATARKSDIHSTLQVPETETDGHTCSPSCRRLNPLFAEHLMGLPLGWTCVSEPLAMESFQRWQLGLSAYLARS